MSLISVTCFCFQLSLCVQLPRAANVTGSLPESNRAGQSILSFFPSELCAHRKACCC